LQEKAKVKGVRIVDHVLVKHGIWVAQNKGWLSFIAQSVVSIINNFAVCCEKHRVYNGFTLAFMVNPPMLALKSMR
jgi:hypothetical protein